MKLLLIRHGQSVNNLLEQETASPCYEGRQADPPLTELGHEQARRLATWVVGNAQCQRVTHLYSSLTTRAVQTAAPLAQAMGLKVQGLQDAYECGGLNTGPEGQFAPVPGRDHASLLTDCPPLLWPAELHGQGWDGGYEPWDHGHFAARAARVKAQLRTAAAEGDVLALVTHHDFAQFLIGDLLALPELNGEALTFRLKNTATTFLELRTTASGTQERVVHWLNSAPHLTPDLITG
ncbi:phosphoglycerate mutase [Deinococcus malanensis]|uniref:Phosphoglycerate mutase n=1 Tax=Deinococcus malanensis TaxID=1706855 RepID=A0ABQ2EJW0_9DEIO|nr:histidine phosphatase family protein [Deinococcus malanensis]GGK12213.1 phosphoglycerate mutase [Deinococcus malanensis]